MWSGFEAICEYSTVRSGESWIFVCMCARCYQHCHPHSHPRLLFYKVLPLTDNLGRTNRSCAVYYTFCTCVIQQEHPYSHPLSYHKFLNRFRIQCIRFSQVASQRTKNHVPLIVLLCFYYIAIASLSSSDIFPCTSFSQTTSQTSTNRVLFVYPLCSLGYPHH